MDQGLAAQAAPTGAPAMPQQGMGGPEMGGPDEQQLIDQLVELLMSGISPEELLAEGVPPELLEAAMQIAMQAMGGAPQGMPEQGPPATDAGLAATAY